MEAFHKARKAFNHCVVPYSTIYMEGSPITGTVDPDKLLRVLLFENRLCSQRTNFFLGLPQEATDEDREWFANILAAKSGGKLLPKEALQLVKQEMTLSARKANIFGLIDEVIV